jgi:alpha-L-fucosidase
MLQHGDPDGAAWRPGESDVSIRPGWFYHPAEDARVKSVDDLVSLYFSSVGRNSKLLLNVPPTRDGRLHDVDVSRLAGLRAALDRMRASDVTAGARVRWQNSGEHSAVATITLRRDANVDAADLREDITHGQIVSTYVLEGRASASAPWQPLGGGTTIGHCKLDRFKPITVRETRLTILDALISPRPIAIRLYESV